MKMYIQFYHKVDKRYAETKYFGPYEHLNVVGGSIYVSTRKGVPFYELLSEFKDGHYELPLEHVDLPEWSTHFYTGFKVFLEDMG